VSRMRCSMAAAHVRLSEARGYSLLRPCCIASGTQARFVTLQTTGQEQVARCQQQERNRLPVKGEIYREPSSSIWAG
jgi:hypothetical protein